MRPLSATMSVVQRNGILKKTEDEISFDCDITDSSISSEEEIASESDFEERVRVRPIQEIWSGLEVRERLMALPGAEAILEQLNDENSALETNDLETLLLLAAWLGNERGVRFALERGQDPNVTDPEGR